MKRHATNLVALLREHFISPVRGVEIGVYQGETSADICREFPSCHLHMVDTWKQWQPEDSYHRDHNEMGQLSQDMWDEYLKKAIAAVTAVNGLYTIWNMTSEAASQDFPDGSLDFAFLDANHTHEAVKHDIELWYPKIRVGGLISGHDYKGYRDRIGQWGVAKAVHEAFGEGRVIKPVGKSRVWAVKKD